MNFKDYYLYENVIPNKPVGSVDLNPSNTNDVIVTMDNVDNTIWKGNILKGGLKVKQVINTLLTTYSDDLKDKLYIGYHVNYEKNLDRDIKKFNKRAQKIANGVGYKFSKFLQKEIKSIKQPLDFWVEFKK